MTKARDLANAGTALTSVSATELGYLDGVTSAVQTQIDAKLATSTASSTYIPKTLTTTTGDIIYASGANTPARLGIGSSSQVLTVSGGVPAWAAAPTTSLPAFSAYNGSNQSFSASTYTKITFPTEEFDTNNNFASSRFTPTVAGYYQISTGVRFSAGSANGWYFLLYKNGTAYQTIGLIEGVDAFRYPFGQGSTLVYLNGSTDYVEIYCAFDGTSPTTLGGSDNVYFTGVGVRS